MQGDSGVGLKACGPAEACASVSQSETRGWVGVNPWEGVPFLLPSGLIAH